MSNSYRHGQAAKAKTNSYSTWKGPKPGTHSHTAAQSKRWKCQGAGGCGYSWNTFDQGICQSCNASWQFDKRTKGLGGKGGTQGAGQDNVPVKPPWVDDPKHPTTTRWGSWDWKWEPSGTEATATPDEAKQLATDILTVSKEVEQLEALLGKEHGEVSSRRTKLDALLTKQKENEPIMPHEQKLRKNLWEVRDCDVKIKKLQATFELAQAKTIAATKRGGRSRRGNCRSHQTKRRGIGLSTDTSGAVQKNAKPRGGPQHPTKKVGGRNGGPQHAHVLLHRVGGHPIRGRQSFVRLFTQNPGPSGRPHDNCRRTRPRHGYGLRVRNQIEQKRRGQCGTSPTQEAKTR
jgi:hypothetical protein